MNKENCEEWKPLTEEEIAKAKARLEIMEMFARIGGRTLGIQLEGDQK